MEQKEKEQLENLDASLRWFWNSSYHCDQLILNPLLSEDTKRFLLEKMREIDSLRLKVASAQRIIETL